MAKAIPDGWETMRAEGAAGRELDTLALLARGLPDDYTVYHAVHWTNLQHGHAIHGEIDFAIVNRAGHLLVIEQKNGFLAETADGLEAASFGWQAKGTLGGVGQRQLATDLHLR